MTKKNSLPNNVDMRIVCHQFKFDLQETKVENEFLALIFFFQVLSDHVAMTASGIISVCGTG